MTDEQAQRAVPSAVLGVKIDTLTAEVLELRRDLRTVVRIDLYNEGRSADHRRIEQTENALRDLAQSLNARRDADERERNSRRLAVGLAVMAAVVSVFLAFTDKL